MGHENAKGILHFSVHVEPKVRTQLGYGFFGGGFGIDGFCSLVVG